MKTNFDVMDENILDEEISKLISDEQYIYSSSEKEKILLPIIKSQMLSHYKNNKHIKSWFDKINLDFNKISNLDDVPMLPTQMFKYFDLKTTNQPLQRILFSSSTTSQTPSKIPISKNTAVRQTKAMLSIIKQFFSSKRRPFLIIDSQSSNKDSEAITARGAAIRGFGILAREMEYAFDDVDGELVFNKERVVKFFEKNKSKEVFALGFTFIIWSKFLEAMKKDNLKFNHPDFVLIHGGGWKKLKNQSVSKETFSKEIAKLFNAKPSNIIDFYGMVEQTGIVFMDCSHGYKHIPNFADVKIRDFYTLEEKGIGEKGFIQILNVLPDSYPGWSILTEDVGELVGVDDCPCGRKGKYFVIKSRLEKTEVRGCGDTFAEK